MLKECTLRLLLIRLLTFGRLPIVEVVTITQNFYDRRERSYGVAELVVGRELDFAVAEAFGWQRITPDEMLSRCGPVVIVCCKDAPYYWVDPKGKVSCGNERPHGWIPPQVSTLDADAGEAMDTVLKVHPDYHFTLTVEKDECRVRVDDKCVTLAWATGKTRAAAVARAIVELDKAGKLGLRKEEK